jgi:hypothetical protein
MWPAMMFVTMCPVVAQVAGSGTIQGTVSDPTGASVAGASVTATNVATGIETVRQTTAAGFYVLSPLPILFRTALIWRRFRSV